MYCRITACKFVREGFLEQAGARIEISNRVAICDDSQPPLVVFGDRHSEAKRRILTAISLSQPVLA
jgi:hypothetical protein